MAVGDAPQFVRLVLLTLLPVVSACDEESGSKEVPGSTEAPEDSAAPDDTAVEAHDSGCTETRSWADLDGDGFGDPAAPFDACEPPSDHVDNDLDCDDTRAHVHPDAQDVCDADDLDEDCDGLADDLDDSVDPGSFGSAV